MLMEAKTEQEGVKGRKQSFCVSQLFSSRFQAGNESAMKASRVS
jgi:hypothetical protein